jgi:hypothetical protein
MRNYLLGLATPITLGALGFVVLEYVDNLKRTRLGWKHDGCDGYHEFRPWLPRRVLRRTFMPVSVWRCNRGAMVPLMPWHSQGRDRSNDPLDDE